MLQHRRHYISLSMISLTRLLNYTGVIGMHHASEMQAGVQVVPACILACNITGITLYASGN